MRTQTYTGMIEVPGAYPWRRDAKVTLRNTSPFFATDLLHLFQQTFHRTYQRGDCNATQHFDWAYKDLHIWFKTFRGSGSFSGAAIRPHNGSFFPPRPATIIARFSPTISPQLIAMVFEHEIRHLMGETHAKMKGTPWQAYRATARMKHHYDWAEEFAPRPLVAANRAAAGRSI